jgi:hypothetical protein
MELTTASLPAAARQPFRIRLDRAHRHAPLTIGVLTLFSVAILLIWDVFPTKFPARAHDVLGALPLGAIALAYLVYQTVRRPSRGELLKATLLAIAFALWALNQLWPDLPQATLLNDLAIALFVLDLFLAIVGRPAPLPAESRAPSPD